MNNNLKHIRNLGFDEEITVTHPDNVLPKVVVFEHNKLFDIVFARDPETGLPRNTLKFVLNDNVPSDLKLKVTELLLKEFPIDSPMVEDDETAFDLMYRTSSHSLFERERFLNRLDEIVSEVKNVKSNDEGSK